MNLKIKKSNTMLFDAQDVKMSYAVSMFFVVQVINSVIKNLVPLSDHIWKLTSCFLLLLMFLILVYAFPCAITRKPSFFFLVEGIMVGAYIISYLRGFADNSVLLKGAFWSICACVPLASLVYSIHDYSYLLNSFRKTSYFLSILLWLVLYSKKFTGEYDMADSYSLVVPTLVILNDFFQEHKIINIFFPCVSTVMIIMFGARGPLFCIGTFVLLYFFFYFKSSRKKLVFFICGLLFITILCSFWYDILKWIESFYSTYGNRGMRLRTINGLLEGRLLESSGRDELVVYYLNLLSKHPIFGLGLYGGWIEAGLGPHNMLIEHLTAFGYPIGSLVCCFSVFMYILPLLVKRGVDKQLLFIFLAYNITMLCVSGDWTEKPIWFMFVAMVLAVWKRRGKEDTLCKYICNGGI